MTEATCKTCPFWWHRSEDGRLVETACRREPQRLLYSNVRDEIVWMWPPAQPDEWCAEHPLRQRERLAAMAMRGIVAGIYADPDANFAPSMIAIDAYSLADAMLAERAKGTP